MAGIGRVWAALTAQVAVESQDVFVGEPFRFEIHVSGADDVEAPDLSGVEDFQVQALGPSTNTSTQMSVINGRVQRRVETQTIYRYTLVADHEGVLQIPPITVRAGNETVVTQQVPIQVSQAVPVDSIELTAELSSSAVYVGEAVTVRWEWFVGQEVDDFVFNLPVLSMPNFSVPEQQIEIDQSRRNQYVRIPLTTNESMIGTKARAHRNGKNGVLVSFSRVIMPKGAGTFQIAPGTVTCQVFAGMAQASPRRRPGGFFNDFFGAASRKRYRQAVISSNSLTLTVKPLPAAGRPANFSGIVGHVDLRASADPTEVSVGEPLVLTVVLSGPEYLDDVRLQPLENQPDIAGRFKVSDEGPGVVEDGTKVFQRTLRAASADVNAIPPIRVSYFDSATGTYNEAATNPIPLTVNATRVVTALDAEGTAPVKSGGATLKAWTQGIAHNYEDLGVLQDQDYGLSAWLESPAWLGALIGFPGIYLVLLVTTVCVRRSQADLEGRRARQALRYFRRGAADARAAGSDDEALDRLLHALREYLGAKFALPAGALIYADVAPRLEAAGVDADVRDRLRALFDVCEAGRYAGGAVSMSRREAVEQARTVVQELEKTLK
jgi:hypothetical protein